ncbi:MAG: amidohydrolase family protein, partial [Methanobacterium sp.]
MSYTLVYNGTLIDGNGGESTPNAAILIKDDEIIEVTSEDSIIIPSGEIKKIDANGMFILPGFIDTHVHIMSNGFKFEDNMYNPLSFHFYRSVDNLKQTINAGVTTIRDAGLADMGTK